MGEGEFKTKKREQTRDAIVEAYVSMLAERDFDAVPVSALCKQAGIVRSTFYTYFPDIYAVAQYVEDQLISKLNWVDVEAEGAASINAKRAKTEWGFPVMPPYGFDLWFDVCESMSAPLRAMLGPHGDPYFEQKLRSQLMRHVHISMDADGMPDDVLRTGFAESLVELHLMLVRNWLLHENTSLTKERIKTIINTMRIGGSIEGRYYEQITDQVQLCSVISPIDEA